MDRSGHDHLRLGRHGEDRAAAWYAGRGYDLLARNWRCAEGELDLVLRRGSTLVVCEVKARATSRYGSPLEAVDRRRQGRLRRTTARWLAQEAPFRPEAVRFDVAAVVGTTVQVVEAAF